MYLNDKDLYSVLSRIQNDMFTANRIDQLEEFFNDFKSEKYLKILKDRLPHVARAKILIIGDSQVNKDDIVQTAKHCGINPNRLEFALDYTKLNGSIFAKLRNNTNYRCVLIGPIPHSLPEKGNYESIISRMEKEIDEYPEVYRITNNEGTLKITKTALNKIFSIID